MIELRNIHKSFDNGITHALADTSFTVEEGELLGLIGESGSGKTTLLQIIGLLDSPTSGSVSIDGKNETISKESRKATLRNQYFGLVYQLLFEFVLVRQFY